MSACRALCDVPLTFPQNMGQAESSSATASTSLQSYHIMRVANGSPAALSGLQPFFDFLQLDGNQSIDSFVRILEERQGREITLQVYSTKRRETRKVRVTPSSDWSKSSTPNQTPSLLGLSLRACDPTHALDQVYHVLGILANSPGQSTLLYHAFDSLDPLFSTPDAVRAAAPA